MDLYLHTSKKLFFPNIGLIFYFVAVQVKDFMIMHAIKNFQNVKDVNHNCDGFVNLDKISKSVEGYKRGLESVMLFRGCKEMSGNVIEDWKWGCSLEF